MLVAIMLEAILLEAILLVVIMLVAIMFVVIMLVAIMFVVIMLVAIMLWKMVQRRSSSMKLSHRADAPGLPPSSLMRPAAPEACEERIPVPIPAAAGYGDRRSAAQNDIPPMDWRP